MEPIPKPVVITLNPSICKINTENADFKNDLDSMPKRWAAILKTSLERFPHDITFSVEGKTISCHKFVLSVASPFFEGVIIKAEAQGQEIIKVNRINPRVFNNILRHIYMDEDLVVADKDLAATMSVAHLCQISDLENLCAKRLQNNLSCKNAVAVFQEADRINNIRLRKRAYLYILINFHKILDSADFLRFTKDQLCEFLKSDDLCAPSEIAVFKGIIRWGEHQCKLEGKDKANGNLRTIMAEIFLHIRMLSITSKAFMSVIKQCNLFYPEDNAKLFRCFGRRRENQDTTLMLKELNLSTSVRRIQISDGTVKLFSDFVLQEEISENGFEGYIYKYTRFHFEGDKDDPPIYLKGVGFAGRPSQRFERVTMQIRVVPAYWYLAVPPILYEDTIYTYIAKAKRVTMIDLNQSVEIFPNMEYTIFVVPLEGGLATWRGRISDMVFYNKMDNLTRPINLKITNSFNHVYSLKFSAFE